MSERRWSLEVGASSGSSSSPAVSYISVHQVRDRETETEPPSDRETTRIERTHIHREKVNSAYRNARRGEDLCRYLLWFLLRQWRTRFHQRKRRTSVRGRFLMRRC